MTRERYLLWIDGRWEKSGEGEEPRSVNAPFDHALLAEVAYASGAQMERAIAAAEQAFIRYRRVSRYTRGRLLTAMREGIVAQRGELALTIAREAGKPLVLAEAEVQRAIGTFTVAAEEALRCGGEIIPVDRDEGGRAFSAAQSWWVPRGPVLGITPFNFPLNLVAHKVAPALAAGCSVLIKPAPQAPGAAIILARIFAEAVAAVADTGEEVPLATLQVVPCRNEIAALAVRDPRLPTLTFTGSGTAGYQLQQIAVGKKVSLELGGTAGVIIHRDADLQRAAKRCAIGGFAYAGQSCISVQRIFVDSHVATRFESLLREETLSMGWGDPLKRDTMVGPLIDTAAVERVMRWIEEARGMGARLVCGGQRAGGVISPTILAEVPREARVNRHEVFAPLVVLHRYEEFSQAIAEVNDSLFGLQAGVFTDSARLIQQAVEELEVGGVLINEVPTFRADHLPYGGVKESGLGREGLRYAMEEYSERKTVLHWRG